MAEGHTGEEVRWALGKRHSLTVLLEQKYITWDDKTYWRTCDTSKAGEWKPVKRVNYRLTSS
ncbi:MAG: hypothetical protein R2688_01500 [Fimbriimonadaceae bacterium]